MNITPGIIRELQPNEVFVFGSNEAGRHGRGAAKTAKQWGARQSVPFGLSGQTFAIPTKDRNIKTLGLSKIRTYVYKFVDFSEEREELKFLVTPIGCGLAGYKPYEIAPMFRDAMELDNVYLPKDFWDILLALYGGR